MARSSPFALAALICAISLVAIGCGSSAASPSASREASPSTSAAASASPARSAGPSATPALGAQCASKQVKFDPAKIDLSGAWAGDDNGIYYLRQMGTTLWWNGMSDRSRSADQLGRGWNNVGHGTIHPDNTVDVDWADVPRGEILGGGTLALKIEADSTGDIRIVKVSETGTGFGNTLWTPCTPG
jgi:hypothetical protein